MSRHRRGALMFGLACLMAALLCAAPAGAAPAAQGDPEVQCARGLELVQAGDLAAALPYLEAGVAGREAASFDTPDELGYCAGHLASIRANASDLQGALSAYIVALAAFQRSGARVQEGMALNNIGTIYHAQGRYAEALEHFQRVLTIMRAMENREGEGSALNNIGTIYYAQGRSAEALEYLQQSLSIKKSLRDRDGAGITLNNIGEVYRLQGRYTEALERFRQALMSREVAGDRAGEGIALNNIGEVYRLQGRYTEALTTYEQALVIHREVGNRVAEGITLNNIGLVYHSEGRYAEALSIYRQALEIREAVGDRTGEGVSIGSIGLAYADQGNYAAALEHFQRGLGIMRAVGNRREESIALSNIGAVYRIQGRDAQALEHLQQALAVLRVIGDMAGEGALLNQLGGVYHVQGHYTEALFSYEQALGLVRSMGDRDSEGSVLNNIGSVYNAQGRYAEALEHLQQALSIRRALGDRGGEGVTLNNIGQSYRLLGRYPEALFSYEQALAIKRRIGDRSGEGVTLNNLGVLYEAQGQRAEARMYYERAIDVLEEVRAQAGDEPGRAGFIERYASLYTRAALLHHDQGDDEAAFLTVERGRARAFLDSLATGSVELSDDEANGLFEGEREAYAIRQASQDALIRARAQAAPDAALVADLEEQLAEAERDYEAVQGRIAARGDQLESLVSARRQAVLSLEQVQAHLPADAALVSYLVGEQRSLAFVLTHSGLRAAELPVGRQQLHTALRALHAFDGEPGATTARLSALHAQLIAPLGLDRSSSRLLIVPHGVLHYLPFAALTPDGQRHLGDEYTISLLPAASLLPFVQRPAAPAPLEGDDVLVMANPDGPRPVVGVEAAARQIGALFGAEPLLGERASLAALRAADQDARLLHLGAHGSFELEAPLESYVQLAPAGGGDDGRLTARAVYGLELGRAELVVLSACETQVNQLAGAGEGLAVSAGDELVGLQRALFYAGAQNVVTTLWEVPDRASRLLMERFYAHLGAGVAPAEALRLAQGEVRAVYPEVRAWAGFVLAGVGATPLVPPPWWQLLPWWAWASAGAFLALCGGALWRRRTLAPRGSPQCPG